MDFFDEQDVLNTDTIVDDKKMDIEQVVKIEPVVEKDQFAGLSARERNQLKRKMRNASKQAPTKKLKEDVTVVSYKPKPIASLLTMY